MADEVGPPAIAPMGICPEPSDGERYHKAGVRNNQNGRRLEVVPNLVGFGGGPPPDACQLVGVRASTKTHERKGTTTYDEEKATPRAGPEA